MGRVNLIDLQHIPGPERREEVSRHMGRESRRPFDLAHDALLRTILMRLSESEHVLLLVMHHIVCDAASLAILFRELRAYYEEFSGGRQASLPALQIQNADYAAWQRSWLHGPALEKQLSYWKARLKGRLPVLELPADRKRPPKQSFLGALHHFELSPANAGLIHSFKRREEATLFNVLLAAFHALVHRYTGQQDLLLGSLTANRSRSEIQGLIGFFANTQVLRTQVDGQMTFRELLARVRETSLGAYANQDLPFRNWWRNLRPRVSQVTHPCSRSCFRFKVCRAALWSFPDCACAGWRWITELPSSTSPWSSMRHRRESQVGSNTTPTFLMRRQSSASRITSRFC